LFRAQDDAAAGPAVETRLLQGHIEKSNVSPSEAAVRLIETGRHFQWMSQATSLISDGMLGQAIERLGRTT
jgi:flagellar basal body rod protein FlgG